MTVGTLDPFRNGTCVRYDQNRPPKTPWMDIMLYGTRIDLGFEDREQCPGLTA
ncbi:MAG: hypothetical protein AABZ67_07595 [Pseudomonadota bacterium]